MDCAFRSRSSCSVLSVSLNPSQSLLVFSTVLSSFLPAIWLRTLSSLLVATSVFCLVAVAPVAVDGRVSCVLEAIDGTEDTMWLGRAIFL